MTDAHALRKSSLGDIIEEADRAFYTGHPELKGRKLSTSSADEKLRSEWNEIFCTNALRRVKKIALAAC
jgi:hypothetical protein